MTPFADVNGSAQLEKDHCAPWRIVTTWMVIIRQDSESINLTAKELLTSAQNRKGWLGNHIASRCITCYSARILSKYTYFNTLCVEISLSDSTLPHVTTPANLNRLQSGANVKRTLSWLGMGTLFLVSFYKCVDRFFLKYQVEKFCWPSGRAS